MAFISITNTFTDGTTAEAAEVNANFSDLVNGLSDGTKDINIATWSVTNLRATGDVIFGSKTSDAWHGDFNHAEVGGDGAIWSETAPDGGNVMKVGVNQYESAVGTYKYMDAAGASRIEQTNGRVQILGAISGAVDATITDINYVQYTPTGATFNPGGVDLDFIVESDGNANMLTVDGANDKFGIGMVPTSLVSIATPTNNLNIVDVPATEAGSTVTTPQGYIQLVCGTFTRYLRTFTTVD